MIRDMKFVKEAVKPPNSCMASPAFWRISSSASSPAVGKSHINRNGHRLVAMPSDISFRVRILSLRNNPLSTFTGLPALRLLTELYLDDTNLGSFEGAVRLATSVLKARARAFIAAASARD
jgi:hypothetical protein